MMYVIVFGIGAWCGYAFNSLCLAQLVKQGKAYLQNSNGVWYPRDPR